MENRKVMLPICDKRQVHGPTRSISSRRHKTTLILGLAMHLTFHREEEIAEKMPYLHLLAGSIIKKGSDCVSVLRDAIPY